MDDKKEQGPKLAVIGVGGAGSNAVNNMIRSGLEGVEFLVCNTDAQALTESLAKTKIQLGPKLTQGLGAGSKPDIGKAAAEESLEQVMGLLKGVNMIFITAGMGGGTGTGAAPVIAKAAREAGILTVGVVTRPFQFEGLLRTQSAEKGIEEMHDAVDTLLVIPNQNLFRLATENTTFSDAFAMADDVLYSGVRTFTDLMVKHGLINLDFADISAVMREMLGKAMMGTGQASGERRAIDAAEQAISCPLLDNDVSMRGARAVLINISGGADMTLFEVDEAANRIREEVDPAANIIFGATFDESIKGELRVAVVATGIDSKDTKADKASEGRVHNVPGSIFSLDEGDSEAEGKPSKAEDQPLFGHSHGSLETLAAEDDAPAENPASLWDNNATATPDTAQQVAEPAPQPQKRRTFNLLERLGMRRAKPENDVTPESSKASSAPVAALGVSPENPEPANQPVSKTTSVEPSEDSQSGSAVLKMQSPVKEGVRKSGPATAPTKAKGAKKVSGSDTLPNSLAEDDMDLPAFMRPPSSKRRTPGGPA